MEAYRRSDELRVASTLKDASREIDEISIKRETEIASLLWFTHLKNLRSIDDQTQMLLFKELTFIIC